MERLYAVHTLGHAIRGSPAVMQDEVQASEQEKAQILLEAARTLMEANRMNAQQARDRERRRKARKPRHQRA